METFKVVYGDPIYSTIIGIKVIIYKVLSIEKAETKNGQPSEQSDVLFIILFCFLY